MNSCNTRQDLGCRGSADEVPGAEGTHQRKEVGEVGALSGPLRPACLSSLISRQSLPLPTPAASHSPHTSCPFPTSSPLFTMYPPPRKPEERPAFTHPAHLSSALARFLHQYSWNTCSMPATVPDFQALEKQLRTRCEVPALVELTF